MIRDYSAHLRYSLFLWDLLLVPVTFTVAYWLRAGILTAFFQKRLESVTAYTWMIPYVMAVSPVVFYFFGCYRPFRKQEFSKIVLKGAAATLVVLMVSGNIVFLAQRWIFSRGLLIAWIGLFGVATIGSRIFIITVLRKLRTRGYNFRTIVIIGWSEKALEITRELQNHSFWGLKLMGVITTPECDRLPSLPVIGHIDEFPSIVKNLAVDDVFYAVEDERYLEYVAHVCSAIGCSLHVLPKKVGHDYRIRTEKLGNIPLLAYYRVPASPAQLFIKRFLDLLLSCAVMLVFPFIYIIVGIAIKLDSPGPILYKGIRVGHNRRRFRCYKFRTMFEGADRMIHLLDQVNELKGPIRKSRHDPRVTRVGRFLRRWSIDEIPQFINVLRGEMSIVGPRPPTPDEVEQYTLDQLRKLSMPQGITGLWQVSGRDAIKSFEERLQLDLEYIDNWSLWLDLKIMAKTIAAILKGGM